MKPANAGITIRFVDEWDTAQIIALYRSGKWWKDSWGDDHVPALIKGSYAFAVAVDAATGTAVGMARVISDGVSDAYIQDFVVLDAYRRQGIGTRILKALVDLCTSGGLSWIGLIAEPGTQSFYEAVGFSHLDSHIPMLFKKEL